MVGQDRRGFLHWLAGGLLCLVPASMRGQEAKGKAPLARRATKPIDDDFSRVLKGTTKANHVRVLRTAKLPPEEKVAIAAARELQPLELEAVSAKLHARKDLGSQSGYVCGGGCDGGGGGTGAICGLSCRGLLGKADAVVDPEGLLQLNLRDLDAAATLRALDKAIAINKGAAAGM